MSKESRSNWLGLDGCVVKVVEYLKRVYTVVEIRTGFVASSSVLLGSAYGIAQTNEVHLLTTSLLFISAFLLNLVANIAAEIGGYLKREDVDHLTGHRGSEGLARNEASMQDAISILVLCILGAGVSGIVAVIISGKLVLIAIGIIGLLAALLYSLTLLSYSKLPISEFVSGIMCGFLCTIVGVVVYQQIDLAGICLALMTLLMVSFLMAANNTVDYEKDLKTRRTWAHVIGFRRSITILIPQIVLLYGLWLVFSASIDSLLIGVIGLGLLTYFGLYKWYIPYYQVKVYRNDLGRIYGPLPLVLLLNFNFIMSGILIIKGVVL